MKVLVTGATGDIGSALCIRLLDSGYRLRALVRNSSDASFLKQKGAELWQGDITDKDSLTGVADNVQAVFHLAAVLWVPNPKVEIPKVNYYGTVNIAQECLDKGIKRFIFTSFPLVLGPHKNTLNELFPQFAPSPPNFYHALYKKKAEEYLLELEREEKLPVSILRLGTVYGPQMLLIRKIVPLIKKGVFAIAGNGDNLVQMVHIDDVLQGMILALEKEKAMGNIYNICDDKTVTMKEFIYAIADELNVRRPPKLYRFI